MIAVLVVALLQDPLEQNFGKLQDAWKAAADSRRGDMSDEHIRAMGKIAAALEAAGCLEPDAPAEARAVKRLIVARMDASPALSRFEKAVARQLDLKSRGLDDEDNLQEVLVEQRKALKELGLMSDRTPQWLRRRIPKLAQAIATGGAFPPLEKATPEQEKRIAELVAKLADSDEAAHELDRIGEPAVPALREAAKSGSERAKKLLTDTTTPAGRAFLGVMADQDTAVADGVAVQPSSDGAAERAGLRAGDVIIEFDGRRMTTFGELREAVVAKSPGDKVKVKVRRAGGELVVEVLLGAREDK